MLMKSEPIRVQPIADLHAVIFIQKSTSQICVMSTLTDILDCLTDIGTLRSQISVLVREQGEMGSIVLKQQSELAELRGQLKAMIQMQSGGDKLRLK
jgi:hypothetical protein